MSENSAIAEMSQTSSLDPETYVENIVKASGTSFYWGMRRLPILKRSAMYAIYAFCREVDDIADGPTGGGAEEYKRQRLGQWRAEIQHIFAGRARTTVGQALLPAIENFGLCQKDFGSVIAGMEMDAGNRVRIADINELTLYCDRVASAVGRLSIQIFGLDPSIGERLAASQGQALQLTNILRDVDEDAGRDRLYLPADVLAAHGLENTENLTDLLREPALSSVCELLARVAERHFQQALELIKSCDSDAARPAVLMLQVYHRILKRLIWFGWTPPRRHISLTYMTKLWIMIRYGIL